MALLVFLRGMNVGGHRPLRPKVLAADLQAFDVVSIGAAGTFIVRRPGLRERFVAELRRRVAVDAVVACCDSRELLELEKRPPFAAWPPTRALVPFVSVLSRRPRTAIALPAFIPSNREWFVRVLGVRGRQVLGVYRRDMRTIGHLGQLDTLFGAPATTRSWSTMLTMLRASSPRSVLADGNDRAVAGVALDRTPREVTVATARTDSTGTRLTRAGGRGQLGDA